jgi:sterol desaturase/sphingolipid hydroxylase (fatty acid hydroxylase superfamily)
MTDFNEGLVRLGVFVAVFAALALLERIRPRRSPRHSRARRWVTNLAIVAIDSVMLRAMAQLAVPIAAVAASLHAERAGYGLINWLAWPALVEIALAVVALDAAIYLQHVASHKVPVFWRLHRVHHADPDIDVTTAVRFHPIEIALSMLYKIAVVYLLGPAFLAVLLFEMLLNGCAMFNHANLDLPRPLDRLLRLVLVTPDMHRVHHSVLRREHDSNYGFCLSVWDRLFGTYTQEPERGHLGMTIGLASLQDERPARLGFSLLLPFKRGLRNEAGSSGPAVPPPPQH